MQRHVADPFVRRAQAEHYRSRGAFKLLQLLAAWPRAIQAGHTVLDLGAAPGGWSQVAAGLVGPRGRVLAIDRLPMAPIPGVTAYQGDFQAVAQSHLAGILPHAVVSYAPSLPAHGSLEG